MRPFSSPFPSPFPLDRRALLRGLVLLTLLALAFELFSLALPGPFVGDDEPSLSGLGRIGSLFSVEFWMYIGNGITGPTGRPMALLSFALQYWDWPDSPATFRLVNILLHLLTGCAIALLTLRLARRWWPGDAARAEWLATLATGLWLLHPLQVSTVVYVVQRMTLLASLFTVLGLLAWCHGRELALREPDRLRGYLWAALGIGGGGLLAVLSKETGVLILAYALVLEHTVFRVEPATPRWRWTRHALLHLPALAFVALVAWRFDELIAAKYAIRDFTLGERLLTEPRVVLDYLRLILLPAPDSFSLFHDDFLPSHGLLQPATTLPALLVVLGLVGAGWWLRARAPVLAFAILWYFAGHLLESTLLPLELYFEHRNYLPLLGPAIGAAHYALRLPELLTTRHGRALVVGLLVLLGLCLPALTFGEATVWRSAAVLAPVWAPEHPRSIRAQNYYASLLKTLGAYDAAAAEFERQTHAFPDESSPYLDWLEIGCLDPKTPLPDQQRMLDHLRTARFSYGPFSTLERIVHSFETTGECGSLTGSKVFAILGALEANPANRPEHTLVLVLRSRMHGLRREWRAGLVDFDAIQRERPRLDVGMERVRFALQLGDLALARKYLDEARRLSIGSPLARLAAQTRFAELDASLRRLESVPGTTR